MKRLTKTDIAGLVCVGCALVAQAAYSGEAFLNLSVGAVTNDYMSSECVPTGINGPRIQCASDHTYLGSNGTLGMVRAGYRTNDYTVYKNLKIGGEIYWMHLSDPELSDGGIEGVFAGIEFKYELGGI